MTDSPNLYQALLGNWTGATDPSGSVVVMQHGINDSSMNGGWAIEVSQALRDTYRNLRADVGQDILNSVQKRAVRYTWGIRYEQFGEGSAWLAAQGILDFQTQSAGWRILDLVKRLRSHLDEEPPRRGEPISFLAHSHGTAMLLAAARASSSRVLDKILLVGSDLNVYTNIAPFTKFSRLVRNYFSEGDNVVTLPTVAAAGAYGFRKSGGIRQMTAVPGLAPLLYEALPLIHSPVAFEQVRVWGIKHSATYEQRAAGRVSWVGERMARQYYGPFTAIFRPRLTFPSQDWRRRYEVLRSEFGGELTLGLSTAWEQPYRHLPKGFLLQQHPTGFTVNAFGLPKWEPDL